MISELIIKDKEKEKEKEGEGLRRYTKRVNDHPLYMRSLSPGTLPL